MYAVPYGKLYGSATGERNSPNPFASFVFLLLKIVSRIYSLWSPQGAGMQEKPPPLFDKILLPLLSILFPFIGSRLRS